MDALFACIEAKKVGMLEALLQDVKDVNVRHEETGLGLLHKAAASGHSDAPCLLILLFGGGGGGGPGRAELKMEATVHF
jgi:hypothetical protein